MPSGLSIAEKKGILLNYFVGWSKVFPQAWEDTRHHILIKNMGISVISRLFETINNMIQSCFKTDQPTQQNFEDVIRKLFMGATITLADGQVADLDWSSAKYGLWSNGKGKNYYTRQLQQIVSDNKYKLLG
ncbi:hypothetical protein QFZ77_007623 [Paenibacillus sp. V4I3]|uniref:hypothetical protein n=1 Tax=Paenibacillus sp. V4I3 TaxID=3042305 RepID=UPI00277E3820|nr:hypothetical protein [Paenibacillus sp. V4I3]MDQ0878964.1 hypothetical protein [Paenibacillus sp. V4I3]